MEQICLVDCYSTWNNNDIVHYNVQSQVVMSIYFDNLFVVCDDTIVRFARLPVLKK